MKPYLILDTNILLTDASNLITLGQNNIIVLPETVLDEIDAKKSSPDPEIRYQVRQLGRLLASSERLPVYSFGTSDILTVVTHVIGNIRIEVVSRKEYPEWTHAAINIINDNRIIQIAKDYHDMYQGVIFMTNDIMCNDRAAALGLNAIDLKIVDNKEIEFTKEITISSDVFSRLHNTPILTVDPDYKIENYNYIFTDETYAQTKLGTIRNGLIDIIGKDTETELRRQDAAPKNAGQLFLAKAIQNRNIDIVVVEASAGTGKTVTAFSNAIQLVKRKEYGGITYIRNSVDDVEKAEEMGFRSGNDEKVAPYFGPVDDVLNFIVRTRYKESKLKGQEFEEFVQEQIEILKIKFNITTSTTLGMRGRTYTNTVVIVDEAQNMSKSSLQKVLTRFGNNCKIIVCGSNKQIDNPYITKYTNGLSILLNACTKEQENIRLHVAPLNKILRSPIAEFAEEVFSK